MIVQFGISEEISYRWAYFGTLPFGLHICGWFYVSYLTESSKGTVRVEGLSEGA